VHAVAAAAHCRRSRREAHGRRAGARRIQQLTSRRRGGEAAAARLRSRRAPRSRPAAKHRAPRRAPKRSRARTPSMPHQKSPRCAAPEARAVQRQPFRRGAPHARARAAAWGTPSVGLPRRTAVRRPAGLHDYFDRPVARWDRAFGSLQSSPRCKARTIECLGRRAGATKAATAPRYGADPTSAAEPS
jgi:hypothetical protein